jgi:isoquinoline 1-oxidoreductase alpha subunit
MTSSISSKGIDMNLNVNGGEQSVEGADPYMPLLWAIRDFLKLKGTKFDCSVALCGACTVHIDGEPIRSCSLPISSVEGRGSRR